MAKTTTTTTTTNNNNRRKNKYNVINRPFAGLLSNLVTATIGSNQIQYQYYAATIVPAVNTSGTRKVGKFTISISLPEDEAVLYWALIYVPKGYNVNVPFSESDSLYEPSQHVLASGATDTNAGPCRIYSPLFKNLNGGDSIVCIIAARKSSSITATTAYEGLCRYAICYN